VNLFGFLAVGAGAAAGAWLRWLLGMALNPVFPTVPLGTFAANMVGGYLMGIALGAFTSYEALSPEARLFLTTGFLGGLTTFSTFSAEATTLLARQQFGWGALMIGGHVVGSILMTFAGIATARLLFRV
jgi:CrcB protein